MLLSRKTLMLTVIYFAVHHLSQAQTNTSDSIYYRNEFSVNAAPIFSVIATGHLPQSAFSIGYAHNFGQNHFLRTGIRFIPGISHTRASSLEDFVLGGWSQWKPDSVQVDKFWSTETKASVYFGYEYLLGRKKFKFLAGIDLMVGINVYSAGRTSYTYGVQYLPDTIYPGYFHAQYEYEGKKNTYVRLITTHFAFMPRIGLRWDASKRIALTLVYTPMFYLDLNPYDFTWKYGHPAFRFYGGTFIAEGGLVIKL